jgi:hypothetical protein
MQLLDPKALASAVSMFHDFCDIGAYVIQYKAGQRGAYGTDPTWTDLNFIAGRAVPVADPAPAGTPINGELCPVNADEVPNPESIDTRRTFRFLTDPGNDIREGDRIRRLSDSFVWYVRGVKSPRSVEPFTMEVFMSTEGN